MDGEGHGSEPRNVVWGIRGQRDLKRGSRNRSQKVRGVVLGSDVDRREGHGDRIEVANAPTANSLPSAKQQAVVLAWLYTYDDSSVKTDTAIEP